MQGRIDEEDSNNIQLQNTSPEDELPPELTKWRCGFLWFARTAMGLGICWLIVICVLIFWNPAAAPKCVCWSYIALAAFLSGLVADFVIRHKQRVHKARKEDRSVVEALIQEAKNIDPKLTKPEMSASFAERKKQLESEVSRLEGLGPKRWTEFQVLTLYRMLIDFLPLEDLKARARSSLDELKEYAEGDAFSYDVSLYYSWEEKITSNIDVLEKNGVKENKEKSKSEEEEQAEALRANLRSLREHVADYEYKWAEGSTIVSSIRICGSAAVVIFTLMGILPILYSIHNSVPTLNLQLGVLSWGYLGVAGSIASALIGLRNSNEVEVGSTSGKRELWRMVLGAPLGLLAGILVFSALAGGLIKDGTAVPSFSKPGFYSAALSIVWAVVAGMGFERVFQRMRGAVES